MMGLTQEDVNIRVADGLVNNDKTNSSRTYADIIIKNVLTPFNIILFMIGASLLFCREPLSAVSATGIIIINILIATIQEIRAKRRLDKIALLTRPKVKVIRDEKEMVIDQYDIVKDDVIVLRSGDQALVDGEILVCKSIEMDESLLTGESSTVRKDVGNIIYSGSICITGECYYKVTAFGDESYASQMLNSARKFISKKTPLQMETESITKVLMLISVVLIVASSIINLFLGRTYSMGQTLETFVVCLDIVPVALFLLITMAYMIAAVRMADSGILLQRSNSVESMSHVDTVCMDKTGTITTNKLVFERAINLIDSSEASHLISIFVSQTGSKNRTVETLIKEYGLIHTELLEEIQFSSVRKFSAVRVTDGQNEYTLYLGAWSVLKPHCDSIIDIDSMVLSESSKGFRTVFICLGENGSLYKNGEPIITRLKPISIVSIRDEVRSDCRRTIDIFFKNNMDFKVISGDDPSTVDALFSIANIPGERNIISGPELDAMNEQDMEKTVLRTNIFGRMKPKNKEDVINILKKNGHYVAMIGDGVNDVKSLKSAQVGITLESGSNAARGVSDMILLNDNFSALPKALIEGRRTVSGMRDILKLYLTRNFALAIIFVVIYMFSGLLPMTPIQNTFYAFVSVSIIAFFMTLFAKPCANNELILPGVLQFCIPSAIIIAIFGLIVYGMTWWATEMHILNVDYEHLASLVPRFASSGEMLIQKLFWGHGVGIATEINSRSALVFFVTIAGILQLLLISPRYKFLSMDNITNKSLMPIGLVIFLFFIIYSMYTHFPQISIELVGLVIFPSNMFAILIVSIILWFFTELFLLKMGVFSSVSRRVENIYIKKLQKEYTDSDISNKS